MSRSADGTVTRLLVEWRQGDEAALNQLLPLVYDQLRRLAASQLRREPPDHSLRPTALINELYLRLVQQRSATWDNRAHFFALAARLMRRVLVDHARARHAGKRGAALTIALEEAGEVALEGADRVIEVLAVDEALDRLAALDAEQAQIVELRFFAGLDVAEVAGVMNRSPRTVKREWRAARAWLYRELRGGG